MSTVTPTQVRVNDPYQQNIFQFNTSDSKLYLSRESNKILGIIGDDIVLTGMKLSAPTIIGGNTVRTNVGTGFAISDLTLIQFTNANNVSLDVSALVDTPVGGARLGVFLKYQYLETTEVNLASIDMFHIQSNGTVTDPLSRFSLNSCRILLGLIDFVKSGSTVTSASISTISQLSIGGVNYHQRGDITDMNLANMFSIAFAEDREYLLKRDFLLME